MTADTWSDGEGTAGRRQSVELLGALNSASRAHEKLLLAQAQCAGLGVLEFILLSRACEEQGIAPMAAGRLLGLSSSTVTGLADRLESDGLIRRAPHPTDRRSLVLRATIQGQQRRQFAVAPSCNAVLELIGEADPTNHAILALFVTSVGSLLDELAGRLAVEALPPRVRRRSSSRRSRH